MADAAAQSLLDDWKVVIPKLAAQYQWSDDPLAVELERHVWEIPRLYESFTTSKLTPRRTSGSATVHGGAVIVDLQMWFSADDSHWLSRVIVEQAHRAEHRNLYLPPHLQGTGEARELWRRELRLYEDLGCIETIWVESERIGRYANIPSGLAFKDEAEREKVVSAVGAVASKLEIDVDIRRLRQPWDVREMPERTSLADAQRAGLVLDAEARFYNDELIPLGKLALLTDLCPSWVGRIDLDPNSESYLRLRDYID